MGLFLGGQRIDATARKRRQVTGRSAFPASSRNVSNASSNTQVQQSHQFVLTEDTSDFVITQGNFYRTDQAATALNGLSTVTIRMAIWDGVATYPIFWPNGSRDMALEPGAIASTAPVVVKAAKGQRLWLVRWMRWATAPANFPAATVVANTGTEFNEMGTALTDRTTNYGQFFTRTVGNYAILPPLAITGSQAPGPVVAILGDSIASDGTNDIPTDDPDLGWAQGGLADAGIPYLNLGTASLALSHVMASKAARAQLFSGFLAAGVTHMLLALSTNDWSNGVSAAQLLTWHNQLKSELDPMGVKVIPVTSLPKTAGNTSTAAEVNTFAQRAIFNSSLRSNNGLGNGFYDLAAIAQSPVDANSWRQDVRAATGITLTSGGTGYAAGDYLLLNGGGGVTVGTVSGGVITALAGTAALGGWLTDPTGPVSPYKVAVHGGTTGQPPTSGTGATFTYTGVAGVAPTSDGTHPANAVTRLIRQNFSPKVSSIFQL